MVVILEGNKNSLVPPLSSSFLLSPPLSSHGSRLDRPAVTVATLSWPYQDLKPKDILDNNTIAAYRARVPEGLRPERRDLGGGGLREHKSSPPLSASLTHSWDDETFD